MNNNFLNYEESVYHLAEEQSSNIIFNEGDDHAIVIFSNIFRKAKNHVNLYAKNIFAVDNVVTQSQQYINELTSFLNKNNTHLNILLNEYNEDTDNNALRDAIRPYFNNEQRRIQFKVNPSQFVKMGDKYVHICIADSKLYRVEYDIKRRKAICCFNGEEEVTEALGQAFNEIFDSQMSQSICCL